MCERGTGKTGWDVAEEPANPVRCGRGVVGRGWDVGEGWWGGVGCGRGMMKKGWDVAEGGGVADAGRMSLGENSDPRQVCGGWIRR